ESRECNRPFVFRCQRREKRPRCLHHEIIVPEAARKAENTLCQCIASAARNAPNIAGGNDRIEQANKRGLGQARRFVEMCERRRARSVQRFKHAKTSQGGLNALFGLTRLGHISSDRQASSFRYA